MIWSFGSDDVEQGGQGLGHQRDGRDFDPAGQQIQFCLQGFPGFDVHVPGEIGQGVPLALAPVQTDEGVDEKGNIGQAEARVEIAQRGLDVMDFISRTILDVVIEHIAGHAQVIFKDLHQVRLDDGFLAVSPHVVQLVQDGADKAWHFHFNAFLFRFQLVFQVGREMKIDNHCKNDNDRGEACRADEQKRNQEQQGEGGADKRPGLVFLGCEGSPPRRSMENILACCTGSIRISRATGLTRGLTKRFSNSLPGFSFLVRKFLRFFFMLAREFSKAPAQ